MLYISDKILKTYPMYMRWTRNSGMTQAIFLFRQRRPPSLKPQGIKLVFCFPDSPTDVVEITAAC